ncbi:MAG: Hpt domain-containing protein [Alkalimonas sp.]|nr:Hpt domain-containing protein [Alkalimonas sp.]
MSEAFEAYIAELKTLDLDELQSFYGELAMEELTAVLQRFYQEAGSYHQRLVNAIEIQNVLEIIRVSHSLKSMAALTGAQQYSALCLWIERFMRQDELDDLMELATYLPALWQQLEHAIQQNLRSVGTPH